VVSRRAVLQGLALTAVAAGWARAQTSARAARVGVLLYSDPASDANLRAFRAGLRDHGWIEGQNLALDYRGADGRPERLPALAQELVRARPDVLFVLGGDVAPAATAATTTIPIVVSISNDPVRSKLVDSLARPGGNVTGCTFQAAELAAKRLELLREAAPRMARLSVLWNPQHLDHEFRDTEVSARARGVDVHSAELSAATPVEDAFQKATAWRSDSLLAVSSRHVSNRMRAIIDFATRERLPLAGGWGSWADNGALLSYGADVDDSVRRAAGYVDRVLKGARPGELPFQQPTKIELVVNLKTARVLGLTPPPSLLARADRVIE
jgi:putative tryptophan/tyrosine transport system substrate-binding protein